MSKIKRILGLAAVTVTALACAGGVWLAGAGTALAPEPAKLKVSLSGSSGATAAAILVNSAVSTNVVKWPGSSSAATSSGFLPAIGTPCSTTLASAGSETDSVIVAGATSTTRRCY